ncbi:hypothetical protein CBM2634_U300005 [Cupriavidus taiwanensis]|uniref:Integrase catalytic domain-containing protein n=1 Tax=Cupriavidus taiwanensis TaxID=164546 RepID=A0A375JCY9_9BURK|nr:hypothetical protein CBM2634_U300005 [Cupriavidus taiwanensis]
MARTKYEEVYLKAYESASHARRSIAKYLRRYNQRRPNSSLADPTPVRLAASNQIGSLMPQLPT